MPRQCSTRPRDTWTSMKMVSMTTGRFGVVKSGVTGCWTGVRGVVLTGTATRAGDVCTLALGSCGTGRTGEAPEVMPGFPICTPSHVTSPGVRKATEEATYVAAIDGSVPSGTGILLRVCQSLIHPLRQVALHTPPCHVESFEKSGVRNRPGFCTLIFFEFSLIR